MEFMRLTILRAHPVSYVMDDKAREKMYLLDIEKGLPLSSYSANITDEAMMLLSAFRIMIPWVLRRSYILYISCLL